MSNVGRISLVLALAAGLALPVANSASAQTTAPAAAPTAAPAAVSGRDNVIKLTKAIEVNFAETPLEDALKSIADQTGAKFEIFWASGAEEGLSKEVPITLKSEGVDALTVLEKVLERASIEAITATERATWQLAPYGSIQLGTRKSLNKFKRVEVYDISDIIFEPPVYDRVPEIDLDQVLQGDGGGGSPFRDAGGNSDQRRTERRQRRIELVNEVRELIERLAEKDQWEGSGGEGAWIRVWQGNIIVEAPDYVHRAVVGYSWWPSRNPNSSTRPRRYVAMSGRTEAVQVINLESFTVQGQTPGGTPAPAPGGNP
jgi:hypothetical protein